MKKILLTLSAITLFFSVNAQTKQVEKWPNGNKRSEGIVLGTATVSADATKEERARQAMNLIKDGKWNTWFENGALRSEEYYSNGAMIGAWKVWYDNGQLESDINFTTGKAIYYYKDGKKQSEGNIAAGMINTGKWIAYYENGNKNYEGTYNMDGKKTGDWTWFNEAGVVTTVQTYENGELKNSVDK